MANNDMANREGLTQNDEYHIFVDIFLETIHVFETDRQGFCCEYMRWHEEMEKTFGVDANIRADAVANMEVTGKIKRPQVLSSSGFILNTFFHDLNGSGALWLQGCSA